MNKYFALRKANRMRTKLLNEKSQEQLKEVIRYLRRVSWDFCGIELVRSDLSLYAAIYLILPSRQMRRTGNCFIQFRTQRPLWRKSSPA